MKDGSPQVSAGFRGRMGNCMFITGAIIGYAKKHNVPWGVPRNTREVPRFHEFFPGLPICENHFRSYQEHPDDAYCDLHKCNRGKCWYNYHPIPFVPGGVTLQGFWQSWKYFEGAEEEVKKAFKLNIDPSLINSMSLHIRLGDYTQYSHAFPPITPDYIREALKLIPNLVDKRLVFSDDIEGAKGILKTYFPHLDWTFVTGQSELQDLSMMASCKYNIIANSTFSWWAGYLNPNPDKIVVSPSHKRGNWYGLGNGVSTDCVDLIPNDWQQIVFR